MIAHQVTHVDANFTVWANTRSKLVSVYSIVTFNPTTHKTAGWV